MPLRNPQGPWQCSCNTWMLPALGQFVYVPKSNYFILPTHTKLTNLQHSFHTGLTIVGKCRPHALEVLPDAVNPPNITAQSSSVLVREKLEQGGGLDPFIGGVIHNPTIK